MPGSTHISRSAQSRFSGGLFPTVTVRQLMWALKMKPIAKECWETVFDRREIYNSSYEEVNRYGDDPDAGGMV